jgi:alpha-galactosidase
VSVEVWTKHLANGDKAVGLFNRSGKDAPVTATWDPLKLTGSQAVRDLWAGKDLGPTEGPITQTLPKHGAALYRLSLAK